MNSMTGLAATARYSAAQAQKKNNSEYAFLTNAEISPVRFLSAAVKSGSIELRNTVQNIMPTSTIFMGTP